MDAKKRGEMTSIMQNRQGRSYVLSALDEQHTTISRSDRGVAKQIVVEMSHDELMTCWGNWIFGGVMVQQAFPTLSPDQREFLISGITPEEWKTMFAEGE